jgi:hypothetical protein
MEPQVEKYLKDVEEQRDNSNSDNTRLRSQNMGMVSAFAGADNSNLVVFQLDLSEEKEKIDHLLRGHVIKRDKGGNEYWSEPNDPTQKSLTDYGVERLMNIINFYLSRNIILSNYDSETIDNKMKDIGWEISDSVFLEYEYIFYQPQIEDLIKRDLDKFSKLYSKYQNDNERLITEIGLILGSYPDEVERIYSKNKRQYPLICRLLIDSIHSAYLRAWKGEERATLRKVMMVTQNQSDSGGGQRQMSSGSSSRAGGRKLWNPMTWLRG